jgi:hypothetical protein
MNQLSRRQDVFRISNAKDPCTEGIDLSRASLPLSEFAGITTYSKGKASSSSSSSSNSRILLADVEGQGDREVAYDARLASSILPLSKCVIFNWKDSLQVCTYVYVYVHNA